MEYDFKKEAKRQYLHYFRFWFLAVAVLAVVCVALGARRLARSGIDRTNSEAPVERVYDFGDLLTDAEEERLRRYIAEKEEALGIDFVVLAVGEDGQYNGRTIKGVDDMREAADGFWDEHKFGYNKGFEGDGVLLLLVGRKGSYLSTSGRAEEALSSYDIDVVLDAVDAYRKEDPYSAYVAYIDTVARLLDGGIHADSFHWGFVFVLPLAASLIYAAVHLSQKPAEKTTTVRTYVEGGKPVINRKSDDFVRKSVTRRRIQTSSGSGGGGHSSSGGGGGGGHHVSSGGASHGGGGRWG